jgi:hypothetical protein
VVSRISRNRVTIGVTAPQDVRIVRGELHPFTCELDHVDQAGGPAVPLSGLNIEEGSEIPRTPR